MTIIGYIGYAILCWFAVSFVITLRKNIGAGRLQILNTLIIVVGAIVIPLAGFDKLHSFWILIAGFGGGFVFTVIARFPRLLRIPCYPLFLITDIVGAIIWFGIPFEKIAAARDASMKEIINSGHSTAKQRETAEDDDAI